MNLNLYLISQNVNKDWDTFDSAIVAASNEEEAKKIHPGIYKKQWDGTFEHTWCDIKDVQIKYIGKAGEDIQKGVICASFNAG